MILKTYTIPQKLSAELNSERGSASIIVLGIISFMVLITIFLGIVDYSLYSEKRDIIRKSIDNSVTAAIQEIDTNTSKEGLSKAYDANTGEIQLKSIYLNETRANNAFYSTFKANTNIERSTIENNALIVIINPQQTNLQYIMQSSNGKVTGTVSSPEQIETVVNNKLNLDSAATGKSDKHIIYVNGNVKTVEFKERPYYLVIVRNLPVKGLFRNKNTTFIAFKGANVERKSEN